MIIPDTAPIGVLPPWRPSGNVIYARSPEEIEQTSVFDGLGDAGKDLNWGLGVAVALGLYALSGGIAAYRYYSVKGSKRREVGRQLKRFVTGGAVVLPLAIGFGTAVTFK